MKVQKRSRAKKLYSVEEANATLPLVRSILRDVTELAHELRERGERLSRVQAATAARPGDPHAEELQQMHAELERDQERMREYERELKSLNVELKDYFTGLVDFPSLMDSRPVFLCWRLGEPEVAYWHEIHAGFAGRQKLVKDATRS
jgi:hypothetical protein